MLDNSMQFAHDDFAFNLDDEWWATAGMNTWKPSSRAYRFDESKFPNIHEIPIEDIAPVRRQLSHGVFNDDAETGIRARERVINILTGIREGVALPPVVITRTASGEKHLYRLTHGAHRFYLSVAAGFTYIPAIVAEVSSS